MIHIATIWQIALATDPIFAAPVASVISTEDLISIPAISGLLPLTDYLARANFLFDDVTISGFGANTPFTTLEFNLIPDPNELTNWVDCE